jgi:glycerol-3-phosphate acyltransferase PlsX
MRIIVDAMGTDDRPLPDILGALQAARETSDIITLAGNRSAIEQVLANETDIPDNLDIQHTDDEIKMDDKPSVVMKRKSGSSMHIGMNMVKNREADAFVTMGNTGAAHAIATLSTLRRITGVRRPALTAIYPVLGKNTIFLDIGANADSRVEWLEQFAIMGDIYARKVLNRSRPRIATLSNGEEEGKGNTLVREAQERIRNLPLNYIGHVEPKEIMKGAADVVVVDGFVGNIFIKTFEAAVKYFADITREEIMSDLPSQIGGLLTRSAFKRVKKRLDTGEVGGAPLLGVNGIVIIGHGGSDARAVRNAIHQARLAIEGNVVEEIHMGLQNIQETENA